MKKNIVLLFLIFLSAFLYAGDLQFFREDLRFCLTDSTFIVDGDYYFRNNSSKEIRRVLFYPFPQDSLYGDVWDVYATTVDSTDVLGRINSKGAFFNVIIKSNEVITINIGYSHLLLAVQAEYILLTTRNWGIPFEEVNYKLEFSKNLKIRDISLIPDDLTEDAGKYYLSWHKEEFMPDTNLIIKFNKPEAE